jgi:hypothetical protein
MIGDFNAKVGKEDISNPNQQLGTRVYKKLIMIMELE